MKQLLLVSLIVLSSAYSYHPIHVSVCEIDFNDKARSLQISQKIFLDDLELDIRQFKNSPRLNLLSPGEGQTTDDLVKEYLLANLKLQVSGKDRTIQYLGHEVEAEAIWCFLEVEKVKHIKKVKVYSNVLCNLYDDQINLVHVQQGKRIRSMKLTPKFTTDEVGFDD